MMRRASWALLKATMKESPMNRSAIGCLFAAFFVALITWLLLPKIPEVGGFLTLAGWIVVAGLLLYAAYLFVTGRHGTTRV
jgi:hypothetical protein